MNHNEIRKLISKVVFLGLCGAGFIQGFSADAISKAYNGIGPQFLNERLRNKVTTFLGIFEPAALVHDLRFELSDGTRKSFDYANCEFFVNCHKCAKAAYPWWNWKRYRAYAIIDAMYEFVCSDAGGWIAWRSAYDKNL